MSRKLYLDRMGDVRQNFPPIIKYDVKTEETLTFQEFCEAVIHDYPAHWGSIIIEHNQQYQFCTKYRNGKIEIPLPEVFKDQKVYNIIAWIHACSMNARKDFIAQIGCGWFEQEE